MSRRTVILAVMAAAALLAAGIALPRALAARPAASATAGIALPRALAARPAASAASARHGQVTIYGCLTSTGRIAKVSVTAPPSCPARERALSWALAARPAASAATARHGQVTIYGCLTSTRRIAKVSVTAPPSCPARERALSWAGTAGPAPTPTPTATSPAPTTPAPTPTASPSTAPAPTPTSTAWAWCTTATNGFFTTPDRQYGIYADEWNSTLPQTVCANTESGWQATFDAPAGGTGILTYPDVQLNYNTTNPAVSGLNPAATARFAENMNTNPGTSAEAAFDIWVTGTGCNRCEVMIWTDTFGRGTVGGATNTGHTGTFCGDSTWQLWHFGSELIWYHPAAMPSGTVCPAAMLQDLQTAGHLPANARLSQFEFGWEIASTGGQPEHFRVTGYSTSGLPPGN
jgi:hypothetical protein